MNSDDLRRQAADLHEYLVKKMGHNWRLATWEKKYEARLRVYGFEKCIIAIDGFHSMRWWMENKSQDAPDCIFRSDKTFERFLASGMILPAHKEENKKREREENDKRAQMAETRKKLSWDNVILTARIQKKLAPLKDEINNHSWKVFIEPLLFVKYEKGVVILFSEEALWVNDHYADRIAAALGAPVKITSEP